MGNVAVLNQKMNLDALCSACVKKWRNAMQAAVIR